MMMKIKMSVRKKIRTTTILKLQCLKRQPMKNQKRRSPKKTRKRRRHLVMISLISNLLLIYLKTRASTLMGTLNLSITSRKKWTRLMMVWLQRHYHLVLTILIISNMMLLMMKILIHLGRSLVRASMKMKIQVRMKECQITRSEDIIQSMSVKFYLIDMLLSKSWDGVIFPQFG